MYRLPEGLRARFQEPFGDVLTTDEVVRSIGDRDTVVAVGDVVARTLIENGRRPKIIVVDFRTQRGKPDPHLRTFFASYGDRVVQVANPAATITQELVDELDAALQAKSTTRIEIDGEEDLAGLPAMAKAPDGTIILYGAPNRGIVRVRVDARVRTTAQQLLTRMKVD